MAADKLPRVWWNFEQVFTVYRFASSLRRWHKYFTPVRLIAWLELMVDKVTEWQKNDPLDIYPPVWLKAGFKSVFCNVVWTGSAVKGTVCEGWHGGGGVGSLMASYWTQYWLLLMAGSSQFTTLLACSLASAWFGKLSAQILSTDCHSKRPASETDLRVWLSFSDWQTKSC